MNKTRCNKIEIVRLNLQKQRDALADHQEKEQQEHDILKTKNSRYIERSQECIDSMVTTIAYLDSAIEELERI